MRQLPGCGVWFPQMFQDTKGGAAQQGNDGGALVRWDREVDHLGGEEQELYGGAYCEPNEAAALGALLASLPPSATLPWKQHTRGNTDMLGAGM